MTIAGSDCSAGAGLQADLKTFQYFGLHGLTAVTSIVSETANVVRKIDIVSPDMMEDQIRLLIDSFPLSTVKTGMLATAGHVRRVAEIFREFPEIMLVIDPVMIASTGSSLLEEDAIAAYESELLPLAKVITPNLPEAERLLERLIPNLEAMETAAFDLAKKFGCSILLKGGHLTGNECTDLLVTDGKLYPFSHPRLEVTASHGTGCTLAAALASGLCMGKTLPEAVSIAKNYLIDCLKNSYSYQNHRKEPLHVLNQGTR